MFGIGSSVFVWDTYANVVQNSRLLLKDKENTYTLEASNYYNQELRESLVYTIDQYKKILQNADYVHLDDVTIKRVHMEFALSRSKIGLTLLMMTHFAFYFKANMINKAYVRAECKTKINEFYQLPDMDMVLKKYSADTGLTEFRRILEDDEN